MCLIGALTDTEFQTSSTAQDASRPCAIGFLHVPQGVACGASVSCNVKASSKEPDCKCSGAGAAIKRKSEGEVRAWCAALREREPVFLPKNHKRQPCRLRPFSCRGPCRGGHRFNQAAANWNGFLRYIKVLFGLTGVIFGCLLACVGSLLPLSGCVPCGRNRGLDA